MWVQPKFKIKAPKETTTLGQSKILGDGIMLSITQATCLRSLWHQNTLKYRLNVLPLFPLFHPYLLGAVARSITA